MHEHKKDAVRGERDPLIPAPLTDAAMGADTAIVVPSLLSGYNVPSCLRDHAVAPLLFYFCSSIALTIFNKWFFSSHNTLGFTFPLTVTCVHQALVAVMLVASESKLKAWGVGEITRHPDLRVPLGFLGVLCGVDWGLSNLSLHHISLSLYEMTKSASPAVVLLVSIAGGLLLITVRVTMIVFLICAGMFLAVSGGSLAAFSAVDFPLKGFLFVCTATLLSGIRVVYAQFALQRFTIPGATKAGVNAVTMLYYSAPLSAISLVVPAYLIEFDRVVDFFKRSDDNTIVLTLLAVFFSAFIAYALSLSEFVATRHTSALTLCVVGVTKQLLLISLAMMIFGDRMGVWNVFGFAVALSGVTLYNYAKRTGGIVLGDAFAPDGQSLHRSSPTSGPSTTTELKQL